jgi:hypothetical protein
MNAEALKFKDGTDNVFVRFVEVIYDPFKVRNVPAARYGAEFVAHGERRR